MRTTTNYGLPQYVDETDIFNKEDFNIAFEKIDRAVGDLQEAINLENGGDELVTQRVINVENKLSTETQNIVNVNKKLDEEIKKTTTIGENLSLEAKKISTLEANLGIEAKNILDLDNKLNKEVGTINSSLEEKANLSRELPLSPRMLSKLNNNENVLIQFVGDSITYGQGASGDEWTFVGYLARLLKEKYPNSTIIRLDGTYSSGSQVIVNWNKVIVNAGNNNQKIILARCGVQGNTTLQILNRLYNYTGDITIDGAIYKPDLISIMGGINDNNKSVSADFYGRTLESIINMIKKKTNSEIILMTPSWNDIGTSKTSVLDSYSNKCKEIALKNNVGIIDIHKLWVEHCIPNTDYFGQGNWLKDDRCHATWQGHEAMGNFIFNELFSNLPNLNISNKDNENKLFFEYTSPIFRYGSGWQNWSYNIGSQEFSEKWSSQANAQIDCNVDCEKIYLVLRRAKNTGILTYSIDGGSEITLNTMVYEPTDTSFTTDLTNACNQEERILIADNLTQGVHSIQVKLVSGAIGFQGIEIVRNIKSKNKISAIKENQFIDSGNVIGTGTGTDRVTLTISFSRKFSTYPIVLTNSLLAEYYIVVDYGKLDFDKFNVVVFRRDGGIIQTTEKPRIMWIAIG